MGVAAAAAAVAAGLVAIRALRPPNPGSAVAQFVAGSNSATTALLSDGSVARLAPGSRLRVASWSTRHRVVDLEGRAFFAVAHDARHPFTVRAAGSETEVLGTRFEVAADRAGVRVVVVEGRVALTAAAGRIEVSAGEVSQAREGLPLSVVRVADVYALLDWPGGLLLFQSTPLAQVAREVGRRFGRPVRVTDGEFARRQVTAWFTDESLEEVVGAICAIVAAHCEMRDTLVTVSP